MGVHPYLTSPTAKFFSRSILIFHFIPSPRGTPDVAVEFQFVALSLRNFVPIGEPAGASDAAFVQVDPTEPLRRRRVVLHDCASATMHGTETHTVYDARHFRGEHEIDRPGKLCAGDVAVNEADDFCSATQLSIGRLTTAI